MDLENFVENYDDLHPIDNDFLLEGEIDESANSEILWKDRGERVPWERTEGREW